MRIIAGKYRGRLLSTVRDLSIRPTTDRAKQTIFDILTNRIDFDGIEVLDLFAGSGSLGLEALSRGAKNVTFVEKVRTSIAVLEKNITALGCGNQTTVHPADVFWFLKNAHRGYDLIFADPPFKLETIGTIPSALAASRATREGTYVVLEYGKANPVSVSDRQYESIQRQFGQTTALILKLLHPGIEHKGPPS